MNEMINRRSFLGFLPATLGLAAVPVLVEKTVPVLWTGEFVIYNQKPLRWSSHGLLITPEMIARGRSHDS